MGVDTKDSVLVVIPQFVGADSYMSYVTPAGKIFAGLHRFPGGKLQEGEHFAKTLLRELREEYAIDLFDIRLHYTKPNVLGGKAYLCSAHKKGEPVPQEPDEVGAVEWMSARETFASDMVPNCKIALCAYLLDTKPKSLPELYPLIVKDEELVKLMAKEAKDFYTRLIQNSA